MNQVKAIDLGERRRILRSQSQAASMMFLTVFFGFIAMSGVIYAPPLGGKITWAVFGLAICTISLRGAATSIVTYANGIRIRNLFGSHKLAWSEIEHFDIGRSGFLGAVCLIHTQNGRVLRAFGIQESHVAAVGRKHPAAEIASSLNEELQGIRGGSAVA